MNEGAFCVMRSNLQVLTVRLHTRETPWSGLDDRHGCRPFGLDASQTHGGNFVHPRTPRTPRAHRGHQSSPLAHRNNPPPYAANPMDAKLTGQVASLFKGETLRGLLFNVVVCFRRSTSRRSW